MPCLASWGGCSMAALGLGTLSSCSHATFAHLDAEGVVRDSICRQAGRQEQEGACALNWALNRFLLYRTPAAVLACVEVAAIEGTCDGNQLLPRGRGAQACSCKDIFPIVQHADLHGSRGDRRCSSVLGPQAGLPPPQRVRPRSTATAAMLALPTSPERGMPSTEPSYTDEMLRK